MTPPDDEIHLCGLDLPVQIGVPDEERVGWQSLQADITMHVPTRFEAMRDHLEQTVDYSAVAIRLRALAAERPRQLIETLAAEMATCILNEFSVNKVSLTLQKRILPGCNHVAVKLTRP